MKLPKLGFKPPKEPLRNPISVANPLKRVTSQYRVQPKQGCKRHIFISRTVINTSEISLQNFFKFYRDIAILINFSLLKDYNDS